MNSFGNSFKPLTWLMALLLAAFVAGCGNSGGGSGGAGPGPGPGPVPGTGGVCAGALCVPLGKAGEYVILAKSGISTTGVTAVTGSLGLSPAAASFITGFSLIADSTNVFSTSSLVTGRVYAADYAVPTPANLTTAVSDMEAAYTDAAGRAAGTTELGAGDISGLTITPGVYKWSNGVVI
ncbi:MAG: ice-binding family protein, partial [Deltaproteobacteria bacterium]